MARANAADDNPALAVPASGPVRIIGIDPGTRATGFGVIEFERNHSVHVVSGVIRPKGVTLAPRLLEIFEQLGELLSLHKPDELAIERVFMHRNADSALKLGQARAAAILAGAHHGLPVFEYSPNEIKQAVTGRGHAAKQQIQHMVRVILCLDEEPQSDRADALAVAVAHGHTRQTLSRLRAVERRP